MQNVIDSNPVIISANSIIKSRRNGLSECKQTFSRNDGRLAYGLRQFIDDEGQNETQGLGIDHYELKEATMDFEFNESTISAINVLNLPDNVLVLDTNDELNREDVLQDLAQHLKRSELSTDSIMYNITEFPSGSGMFRVQEETNVGSYKALKK